MNKILSILLAAISIWLIISLGDDSPFVIIPVGIAGSALIYFTVLCLTDDNDPII